MTPLLDRHLSTYAFMQNSWEHGRQAQRRHVHERFQCKFHVLHVVIEGRIHETFGNFTENTQRIVDDEKEHLQRETLIQRN